MASVVLTVGLALIALGAQPSVAVDDGAVHSDNVELVGSLELHGALSLQFSSRRPHAYVHSRERGGMVKVLDISDPLAPRIRGEVEVKSGPYMEDMQMGERPSVTFVLVNADSELVVVDVTDPDLPRRRSALMAPSHTYECVDAACMYAYTTRTAAGETRFAVVDLRKLDEPSVVADDLASPIGIIHDWHRDGSGKMWALGGNGIAAYDVTDPVQPRLLNSSDVHGLKSPANPYNDRLWFHGAQRPNARSFDGSATSPSLAAGNVLLVSEEGDDADCTDSFQTWFVPSLSGEPATGPPAALGLGTVTPISHWSLLSEPTTLPLDPALCSVHWFDYHEAGFVALPTYASGTRVLDVRDPANIRQVAFHYDDDTQAIQSYWVPERHGNGRTTGRRTNLIYTTDIGLGTNAFAPEPHPSGRLDVFRVDPALLSQGASSAAR